MSDSTSADTEFQITVHPREGIIEVRYPARPTEAAVQRYAKAIRTAVTNFGGKWKCLVDSTALKVMPPELTPIIAELNHWALEHGMQTTARVVKDSAISEMQARRILREGGIAENAKVYASRDEAWADLVRAP